MASSKAGLEKNSLVGIHHCKNCGNTIEEFFFKTKKHCSEPSDVPYDITCIKCGMTSPIQQVRLQQTTEVDQDVPDGDIFSTYPSQKDLPNSTTCSADDLNLKWVKNCNTVQIIPSQKMSRENSSLNGACSSKRHKVGADMSMSLQASTQAQKGSSPINSQISLTKMKSSFFNQACPCGSSDRADFLYVTDNEDGEIMMRECQKCSDTIGIDDTTYDEVLSWMESSGDIRVSICDCGNEDPNTYVFEQVGNDIVLRCDRCEKTMPVSSHDADPTESGSVSLGDDTREDCVEVESHVSCCDLPQRECTCLTRSTSTEALSSFGCSCVGHPCGRTRINPKSAQKLNPGDHLAWHRPLGYWHHAIVVRCSSVVNTTIRVIHYAEPTTKSTCKGKIIEDWIDICTQRGDLYRLEYKPETVFDSDMVIERGRTRLGEVQYNLFDNNCEHFARWCKTGVGKSEQVESFAATLKRIGHKTLVNMGAKTARAVIGRAVSVVPTDVPKRWLRQIMPKVILGKFENLSAASAPSGAAVARNVGKELTRKQACSVVAGAVAFTIIVGIEVYSLYHEVKEARDQHQQGDITREVYANIVVRRSCRTVGAVVGATAGAVIPIPIVSTLVGSTLGSLIGEGVGVLAGRHTSKLIAAKLQC